MAQQRIMEGSDVIAVVETGIVMAVLVSWRRLTLKVLVATIDALGHFETG